MPAPSIGTPASGLYYIINGGPFQIDTDKRCEISIEGFVCTNSVTDVLVVIKDDQRQKNLFNCFAKNQGYI